MTLPSSPDLSILTVEDIFSDTDLHAAEKMFISSLKTPVKCLREDIEESIVIPSIEMINYRTKFKHEPTILAIILEAAVTAKYFKHLKDKNIDPDIDLKRKLIASDMFYTCIQEEKDYPFKSVEEQLVEINHWPASEIGKIYTMVLDAVFGEE